MRRLIAAVAIGVVLSPFIFVEALLPLGAPGCVRNRLDSPPDGDLEIIADE